MKKTKMVVMAVVLGGLFLAGCAKKKEDDSSVLLFGLLTANGTFNSQNTCTLSTAGVKQVCMGYGAGYIDAKSGCTSAGGVYATGTCSSTGATLKCSCNTSSGVISIYYYVPVVSSSCSALATAVGATSCTSL